MSSVFRPSTIDDEPRIVELLTRAFSAQHDAPFLNPSLLRWKYWDPRLDFSAPRSFVVEKNSRIVAHAGIWPVAVPADGNSIQGVHMIDWASDPEAPGAGVSLLQRLTKSYDFVYSIGGSGMTESILPKFGFQVVATARTFARPIRPWRQILQHPSRDVRLPARLVRNIWWSRTPANTPVSGWEAVAAAPEDAGGIAAPGMERDGNFFRYLQQCPAVRFLGFHIVHQGRKSGYFALTVGETQARLAGAWLENPDQDRWRVVFQLARDTALRHTSASELIARTGDETSAAAATQAGMRLRVQTPVFLFRKGGGDKLPLQFQLLDNDAVFLTSPGSDFLT